MSPRAGDELTSLDLISKGRLVLMPSVAGRPIERLKELTGNNVVGIYT